MVSFYNSVVVMDRRMSRKIQMMELSHNMEYYLVVPTMLFGRHVVPYLIVFSFLLFRLHVACYIGLSCLLCVVITEPLKYVVQRSRPRKQSIADRLFSVRDDVSNPAFPSGDSAQAAVFSGILYHFFHAKWLLLLPLPTMFGRVYYGAHWIGDTIGGIAIGFWVSLFLTPFIFRAVEMILGDYLPQSLL
ncbi:hypothetical protein WA538_004251, partial [Blastocystis sp. DL]